MKQAIRRLHQNYHTDLDSLDELIPHWRHSHCNDGLITSNFRPKRHHNQGNAGDDVYTYRIVAEDNVPSSSVGYPVAKQFDFPRQNAGKHAYYRSLTKPVLLGGYGVGPPAPSPPQPRPQPPQRSAAGNRYRPPPPPPPPPQSPHPTYGQPQRPLPSRYRQA